METERQEQDIRFGNAVRLRRTQLGITLDQLAGTSGVSAAVLSRVERGLLSPTLRNALAIARGLGCELGELVKRENAQITRAGDNLRFVDNETGIERLALARPTPEIELLAYTVPPGATSSHFSAHAPGTKEIFHLIAGQLTIHTAQETITLNDGDTAALRVDSVHWFSNDGSEPASLFLAVLAP